MKSELVLAILFGHLSLNQAVKLGENEKWTYIKFDPFNEANNADMDEQVKRFNEASRGIVKTNAQRAEDAARAKKLETIIPLPILHGRNSLMQIRNPIPGISDDDEYPKTVPKN